MADTPVIIVDKVVKRFNAVTALNGIELQVAPNQIYGLIGPDGAGKTTTMRILATVLKPTLGTATVFGHDVSTDSWPIKHRIGYMPQNFSLYRDLSVAENIAFYAGVYHVPKKIMAERVKWLLDFTGLGPFTERIADALSGGMKQKLALACALIHEPDLLLLDEPTIGVDPVARREFWKNIETLVARGKTVFVSTPYMDEAERCHRIAFINQGSIVMEGSADGIKRSVDWKQFTVRGPNLRELLSAVRVRPGVIGAQLVGTTIRAQVEKQLAAESLRASLPRSDDYVVEEIIPGLEDVFAHLLSDDQKKETTL